MGAAVGIDLGTTNTVVSAVKDGWPVTLVDEMSRRLLPSVVSFHPSGKVLVGHSARERRMVDATNTIASVKRLIGRPWSSIEVQRARKTMAFELVEGDTHEVNVVARGERYTLPEISAFILRRARAIAEGALGQPVDRAVITVPANFNDLQREATKLAGKLAGLEVLRILSEPTAAALAYGESVGKKERVAVYDLGGGTFDVTLLDVSGQVFQVLATGGDTALGGDDLDELVAGLMTESLLRQHHYDARTDPTARAILKARAEELKILLSANLAGEIPLNNVVRGEAGAFLPASFRLDRRVLETLAAPLIDRTLETSRRALERLGMGVGDVDRVLLVGGSTRMPLVGRRVEEYFERKVSARVNPDEVVAHGAAIQALALARGDEVASPSFRPSFRPQPSFSFAPAFMVPAPERDPHEPRLTPRVGEVVVPLPPRLPERMEPSATTAPAESAPPSRGGSHPPDSARSSAPPLSQDQEALLRAFLEREAASAAAEEEAPSAPPPSLRESTIESELVAFLSDAPPPLEAPSAPSLPPASLGPKSQKPPQIVAIESELVAFLSDVPPPLDGASPSEGIVAVVDQPAPRPLRVRSAPAPSRRAHRTLRRSSPSSPRRGPGRRRSAACRARRSLRSRRRSSSTSRRSASASRRWAASATSSSARTRRSRAIATGSSAPPPTGRRRSS